MPNDSAAARCMARAIELARRGEGYVEPNPMVGCLITDPSGAVLGEGWHRTYGGPHAEVEALQRAGERARGGTLYVSLEPCCHLGKTPPCTQAILRAGIGRVVVAITDPFPQVAGNGIRILREAGIPVEVGVEADAARDLLAPYIHRLTTGRPWVIAKWAMTLDGKMATHTGESQWISSQLSRSWVHQLRGRMDAILIGRQTAQADNPELTARPPGPRIATRIVLDSQASLALDSKLARTAGRAPVLVVAGPGAPEPRCRALEDAGVEVVRLPSPRPSDRLAELLDMLGARHMTNLLVEGGGRILGSFLECNSIDEIHVFVAGKLVGGDSAPSPISGHGIAALAEAPVLDPLRFEVVGKDVHLWGRVRRAG